MKTIRPFIMPIVVMLVLGATFSVASGRNPPSCNSPAPPKSIPNNVDHDDAQDGNCNEDEIASKNDHENASIPEDPHPAMCDREACIGTDCSSYALKYFPSSDLLTPDANITRAIIGSHGLNDANPGADDRPYIYYKMNAIMVTEFPIDITHPARPRADVVTQTSN